ncbi:MAG TPA: helix-turn-helix transcriptional regulator, partial [Solirubrobacteraceae bacterium]|nr:helix-turn-helix transcriptional regulator [Solirubrobacteraceae bacterium]
VDAVREQLASNLRRHRKKVGLSQERLAQLCDLDRTEISLLECGKRFPRLDTLVRLSRALKLASTAELIEGVC